MTFLIFIVIDLSPAKLIEIVEGEKYGHIFTHRLSFIATGTSTAMADTADLSLGRLLFIFAQIKNTQGWVVTKISLLDWMKAS
jgi:hypothetical protein